ncbi:MAG: hypothetical protein HY804_02260 [Nitrospinae bacterium]|nr:hypothetical protein [Nitrospinota bacterium]
MRASLIFHDKWILESGIAEIKIWSVRMSKEKPEGYKYSMVWIVKGQRIIGYDNAEGKGHHRHYRGMEEPYIFTTIARTFDDFWADVNRELEKENRP